MAQGASLGGAAAPAPPDEPSPYFQRWALQTLAGGAAGATYGSLSAYLAGQPMTFYASAYGANTAIFTGSFLALRHALYAVASPATARDRAAITGVAGAAVGGLFTGIVSGPRKVPLGALLWAAGSAGGQVGVDRWSDFRSVRAGAILRQRAQWAQLTAEEQAAYHELTARARSGRLAVSSLPGSGEAHRWIGFQRGDHRRACSVAGRPAGTPLCPSSIGLRPDHSGHSKVVSARCTSTTEASHVIAPATRAPRYCRLSAGIKDPAFLPQVPSVDEYVAACLSRRPQPRAAPGSGQSVLAGIQPREGAPGATARFAPTASPAQGGTSAASAQHAGSGGINLTPEVPAAISAGDAGSSSWTWLPIHRGAAEARRRGRLQRRLAEIDEALGAGLPQERAEGAGEARAAGTGGAKRS
jgi:hypothetical protein